MNTYILYWKINYYLRHKEKEGGKEKKSFWDSTPDEEDTNPTRWVK